MKTYQDLLAVGNDAYMQGDKVYFPNEGDPVYVSTVDNNVWQPGVYGWKAVQNE